MLEFAPLAIPFKRRIETAIAALWISTMLCGEFIALMIYLYIIIFTRFYLIGILYAVWLYYDRDRCNLGGRSSKWVRNWGIWGHFRDYFPVQLVKTHEMDPDKNYLLCMYPHGILCTSGFVNFATDATGWSRMFPKIVPHLLTLEVHFNAPLIRDYFLGLGACSASAKSIDYILSNEEKGQAAVLIVGGAAESLNCHPGEYKIVLKRRRGFVRLAIKNGASLVPVFSFGETDIYDQLNNPEGSNLRKFQEWVKKTTGIAPAFFLGRGILQYSFGVIPNRRPLTTVVGAPIDVHKNPDPTEKEIDELHATFTKALVDLFNLHKKKYIENHEKVELILQ